MKINVTSDHIKRGARKDCYFCPVALAIAEQTIYAPVVERDSVLLGAERRNLPPEAVAFIANFDSSKPVAPFKFEIPI